MSQSLLDLLKAHNPELFDKEGNFKFADFRTALAEADSTFSQETYRLDWRGKSYAKALVYDENRTLLSANHSHNANNLDSQNVLIQGDNLAVLKHLREAYRKQIKMIYIDPPYNTGSDGFVYQDDRKYTPEQIAQITGESEEYAEYIHDFINAKASSHSAWLTFMYPRLKLARELLKDDGVIFISIDDNEQAQLKLLCDEIFGEGNFVANIIWQKKTGSSDEDEVAVITEYILMYRKTDNFIAGKNSNSYDINRYNLTDEYYETRGQYYTDNLDRGGLQYSDSMNFGIESPDGSLIFPNGRREKVEEGWIWKWSKDKVEWGIKNGFIVIKKSTKKECGWAVYYKNYLFVDNEDNHIERSAPYKNIIIDDVLNTDATIELKNLLNANKVFSSPKPTYLIKKLINMVKLENNDIILDFFVGSGTTAHSIMQLNAENQDLHIKYMCIQLPENLDENLQIATSKQKEIIKNAIRFLDKINKPHNIFEITKARIQKSIEKIKKEHPDFTGDLGFKEYRIVPAPDNFGTLADNPAHGLQLLENLQLSDTDCQNILTTWCVQDGMPLHHTPKQVDLGGYIAYRYDTVLYLLNKGFDTKHLAVILRRLDDTTDEFNIDKIVILEPHFDSKAKRELTEAIGQYKPRKGNKLYLIVRNRADKG